MRHNDNVIGPMVSKLRYERGWKQDDLVAKLQLTGCYMTRYILANIETRRSSVTDIQIRYFCKVFDVEVQDLFPPDTPDKKNGNGELVGMAFRIVTRHRHGNDESQPDESGEQGNP